MGAREWLLLSALSILWGCSFLFVEVALRDIPVFTVALGRTGIAAGLLIVLLVATRFPLSSLLRRWREFLVLGALRAAIPMSLIIWAQTRIDSGVAGILNSTSPLFTMVIAHLLTSDDRMSPQKLAGCLIGMLGVVAMIGTDFVLELGSGVAGQLAMLGATCSYGFAAVYGRRFDAGSNTASAAGMLCGATLLILPVALVIDAPWTLNPGVNAIAALVGLALLSTAVAFIVWFKLITTAGPSNTSLVTFLIPFTALGFGILLLGEKISMGSLLGLAIILAGLAVTQIKSSRPDSSVQATPAGGRTLQPSSPRHAMMDTGTKCGCNHSFAVICGTFAGIAVALFLAGDRCLDRGGRVSDTAWFCEDVSGAVSSLWGLVSPGMYAVAFLVGVAVYFVVAALGRRWLFRYGRQWTRGRSTLR
jgi:drug/metabolite transporter (DMT)-like permease